VLFYFLIASLPSLTLDEKTSFSREEFLSACRQSPTPLDLDDIRNVLDGNFEKVKHPFIQEWLSREILIRNNIARSRAAKAAIDAKPFLRESDKFSIEIEQAVETAFAEPNPLKRELALDQFRWKMIDEMFLFQPFSLAAIFGYTLKLRIALRWTKLEAEKGRQILMAFLQKALVP